MFAWPFSLQPWWMPGESTGLRIGVFAALCVSGLLVVLVLAFVLRKWLRQRRRNTNQGANTQKPDEPKLRSAPSTGERVVPVLPTPLSAGLMPRPTSAQVSLTWLLYSWSEYPSLLSPPHVHAAGTDATHDDDACASNPSHHHTEGSRLLASQRGHRPSHEALRLDTAQGLPMPPPAFDPDHRDSASSASSCPDTRQLDTCRPTSQGTGSKDRSSAKQQLSSPSGRGLAAMAREHGEPAGWGQGLQADVHPRSAGAGHPALAGRACLAPAPAGCEVEVGPLGGPGSAPLPAAAVLLPAAGPVQLPLPGPGPLPPLFGSRAQREVELRLRQLVFRPAAGEGPGAQGVGPTSPTGAAGGVPAGSGAVPHAAPGAQPPPSSPAAQGGLLPAGSWRQGQPAAVALASPSGSIAQGAGPSVGAVPAQAAGSHVGHGSPGPFAAAAVAVSAADLLVGRSRRPMVYALVVPPPAAPALQRPPPAAPQPASLAAGVAAAPAAACSGGPEQAPWEAVAGGGLGRSSCQHAEQAASSDCSDGDRLVAGESVGCGARGERAVAQAGKPVRGAAALQGPMPEGSPSVCGALGEGSPGNPATRAVGAADGAGAVALTAGHDDAQLQPQGAAYDPASAAVPSSDGPGGLGAGMDYPGAATGGPAATWPMGLAIVPPVLRLLEPWPGPPYAQHGDEHHGVPQPGPTVAAAAAAAGADVPAGVASAGGAGAQPPRVVPKQPDLHYQILKQQEPPPPQQQQLDSAQRQPVLSVGGWAGQVPSGPALEAFPSYAVSGVASPPGAAPLPPSPFRSPAPSPPLPHATTTAGTSGDGAVQELGNYRSPFCLYPYTLRSQDATPAHSQHSAGGDAGLADGSGCGGGGGISGLTTPNQNSPYATAHHPLSRVVMASRLGLPYTGSEHDSYLLGDGSAYHEPYDNPAFVSTAHVECPLEGGAECGAAAAQAAEQQQQPPAAIQSVIDTRAQGERSGAADLLLPRGRPWGSSRASARSSSPPLTELVVKRLSGGYGDAHDPEGAGAGEGAAGEETLTAELQRLLAAGEGPQGPDAVGCGVPMTPQRLSATGAARLHGPVARQVAERLMTHNPLYAPAIGAVETVETGRGGGTAQV